MQFSKLVGFCLVSFFSSLDVSAQIVPDNTLSNPSIVRANSNQVTIEGGTTAGSNLFHSFQEFSVPNQGLAHFNNSLAVGNIFSRITGVSPSNINGIIKTNGATNLFLINPNGIVFGQNASLNIGGSFLATTAQSISFKDGTTLWSSPSINTSTVLTSSVPIGLGFSNNVGQIRVEDEGHNASASNFSPLNTGSSAQVGLTVLPQRTFGLVASNVSLQGGILTAPSGRIELGSLTTGSVQVDLAPLGFELSYEDQATFGEIMIGNFSLVDASDQVENPLGGSSIQIVGKNMDLSNSSLVSIVHYSDVPSGEIRVSMSESFQVFGTPENIFQFRENILRSGIWSETLSAAAGSNITISSPQVNLFTLAQVFSSAYDGYQAPNITLTASSIDLSSDASISSASLGARQAGTITIDTEHLSISNGATVTSTNATPLTNPVASGNSGIIDITADTIQIAGSSSLTGVRSTISSVTFATGNAGTVNISTDDLFVLEGARIDASSGTSGNSGIINIEAELVEVNGVDAISGAGSSIQTLSRPLDPLVEEVFRELIQFTPGLAEPGTEAGEININATRLNVIDGGEITASNDALFSGGDIEITDAESVFLQDGQITAFANESGRGGNISISAETVIGTDNSNIIANSFQGLGGNIDVNSDIILGFIVREGVEGLKTEAIRNNDTNDITAFSEQGIEFEGEIEIDTDLNLQNELTLQDLNLVNVENLVATSCRDRTGSSFTITGSENTPLAERVSPSWELPSTSEEWHVGNPIEEGTQIEKDEDGEIVIVSAQKRDCF